jgi:hypothetical protein
MRVESWAEKNAYPRPSLELELLGFVVSNLSGLASVFVRDEENEWGLDFRSHQRRERERERERVIIERTEKLKLFFFYTFYIFTFGVRFMHVRPSYMHGICMVLYLMWVYKKKYVQITQKSGSIFFSRFDMLPPHNTIIDFFN